MCPDAAERRLAAIPSADVVGYRRLMAEDEAATIRTPADRREVVAEPGAICISAAVHEPVRRELELGVTDLGSQKLEKIPEPVRVHRVGGQAAGPPAGTRPRLGPPAAVAAGLLVLVVGGLVLWRAPGPPSEPPVVPAFRVPGFGDLPAIAVLAFDDLSGDPEHAEAFAGMALAHGQGVTLLGTPLTRDTAAALEKAGLRKE